MNTSKILVCVSLLFIGFLIIRSRENFGQVLGAAAPYHKHYVRCLNECHKQDPTDRMGVSPIRCGHYCDDVISELAKHNVDPLKIETTNNLEECSKWCNVPNASPGQRQKCISDCYGKRSVNQWCEELWCPYSKFPKSVCMSMCASSQYANNNQNAWKWGRFG